MEFAVKLELPPDGIEPPSILQPPTGDSEFVRLEKEMTAAGYVPNQMGAKLQSLGPARRDAILRYIAGDVAIARGVLKRPQADSSSYDTDILKYEQEVEKFIRLSIVPISKIIQAYEISNLADVLFPTIPGFKVTLPIAQDRQLLLNLDKTTSTSQGLAKAFYVLLPNAKTDIPTEKALQVITRMPAGEARELLDAARLDNTIDITSDQVDKVIVWMAEFRLQLRQPPEWAANVDALLADSAVAGALSSWLQAQDDSTETYHKIPVAGRSVLEWKALTLAITKLETSLQQIVTAAPKMIAKLAQFSDVELRDAINTHGGITPAEVRGWPDPIGNSQGDVAVAIGRYVEFVRAAIPYRPTGGTPLETDSFNLCLGMKTVGLDILQLKHIDRAGAPQTITSISDLRHVPDTGAGGLIAALHGAAATVVGGVEAWTLWPASVRGSNADTSVDLFFDHIRRAHPSAATGMVAFFAENPRLTFPLDLTASGLTEIETAAMQAAKGDARNRTKIVDDLKILNELWDLTRNDSVRSKLRSAAVAWLADNGKTTQVSVGAITDIEIDVVTDFSLRQAIKNARDVANGVLTPNVPGADQFACVNADEHLVDCMPPDHRSPVGPTAYLAYLHKTATDAALPLSTRPDIPNLVLDQLNTETLVPEIDLVNELLESLCSGSPLTARQTTLTADELIVTPEFSVPNSPFNCRIALRDALSPSPLSYDQRLETARTYLHALELPREGIMRAFRKEVAWLFETHSARGPMDEQLAWEWLRFTPQEIATLSSLITTGLHKYFAFDFGMTDAAVVADLSRLHSFLRHCELELDDFKLLLATQPNWLTLTTTPSAIGCSVPTTIVQEKNSGGALVTLTRETLGRLYQQLRLWRHFRGQFGRKQKSAADLKTLNEVTADLQYFRDNAGTWEINSLFFWELASLQQLCGQIPLGDWVWHSRDTQKGGLSFATALIADQRQRLSAAVPLPTARPTTMSDADWTALEAVHGRELSNGNWLSLETMCGVRLADTSSTVAQGRDERIRRAVRLTHLATTIDTGTLPLVQLQCLFWGRHDAGSNPNGADGRLIAAPNPRAAFFSLNKTFRDLPRPALADESPKSLADVKDLLESMCFGADASSPISDHSSDGICGRLFRVLRDAVPQEEQYSVPYPLGIPALTAQQNLPVPFVIAAGVIRITRSPQEEEIIHALRHVSTFVGPGWTDAKRLVLRKAIAEVAAMPRNDLRFLTPILPNQLEAVQRLIDPDLLNSTRPLENRKWGYVYRQIELLRETIVKHFIAEVFGGQATPESRQLLQLLLFGVVKRSGKWVQVPTVLRPFSAANESPYRDDDGQSLLELPSGAIWRDLVLPRGSGLTAIFTEGSPSLAVFERRDAALLYVRPGEENSLQGIHPWPHGMLEDTPDPTQIPTSLDFHGTSPPVWQGSWKGLIHLPHDRATQDIFIAVNLGSTSSNNNRAEVGIGTHTAGRWKPRLDQQGRFAGWDQDTSPHIHVYSVYGPYSSVADVETFTAKFEDGLAGRGNVQFNLTFATVPKGQAQPPVDLGNPTQTPRLFRSLVAEDYFFVPEGAANPLIPQGWEHYIESYRRVWLACYYAFHQDLLPNEVLHFSKHPIAFAGLEPTFGFNTPTTTEPFDLNIFHPLPVAEERRCALFDQWERLREYTSLRAETVRAASVSKVEAADRLLAAFDLAYDAGGVLDPTVVNPANIGPVVTAAFGWQATDNTIVEQCFDYLQTSTHTNYRLKHQDLQNQVWLWRIRQAADVLRRKHPWMGTQQLDGDICREVSKQDLTATAISQLRQLFGANHDSGAPATDGILTSLHNLMRQRGRAAMLAYLSVQRIGGGRAGTSVRDLSRELLIDVDCDTSRQLTRVESAITSIQRFLTDERSFAQKEVDFDQFEAWQARITSETLFPENIANVHPVDSQTLAWQEFRQRLYRSQLSLHKTAGQEDFEWLEDVESLSRQGEESLHRGVSAVEPRRGWLAPVQPIFPNGWQSGPNDLTAAILFKDNQREYLFWPVATEDHIDDSQARTYQPPNQDGSPSVAVQPRPAIRLGWSSKFDNAANWSASQLSAEWVAVPDPIAVSLSITSQGEMLLVSCGGGGGFQVPKASVAPKATPVRRSGSPRFLPASSYGGMTSLPLTMISDRIVIAPDVPISELPGGAARPAFGLSDSEQDFFVPLAAASNLVARRKYDAAQAWLKRVIDPFNSNLRWDSLSVRNRASVLQYLSLLRQWALDLLSQNTEESCRLASVINCKLSELLGPVPRSIAAEHPSGVTLTTAITHPDQQFESRDHLLNPRLKSVWSFAASLEMTIRRRLNPVGNLRPQASRHDQFFQPATLVPTDASARSPYRFTWLVQKALEAANETRSLGQAMLSAIEKGDTEHLSLLRATSEKQISQLNREQRQAQWAESETQWRILRQSRFNTEFRKRFYEELISGGLNGGESSHLDLLESAEDLTLAAQVIELAAQAISLIPDMTVGGAGISSPVAIAKLTGGEKISRMMEFIARGLHSYSGKLQSDASQTLTRAGYERRRREWEFQRDSAAHEITAMERQIDGAHQRMLIARRELNIQQQQYEMSCRHFEFLRAKYSNTELNDLLRDALQELYERSWQASLQLAHQCEQAYRLERHYDDQSFLDSVNESSPARSPLAGEHLISCLRRMEKHYHDTNHREHELTQHFSLRLHQPAALVALRTTGVCEIDVPEWIFDLNYPGHFLRRIKSVSVSLPCVLAPYQTVNSTLTQITSAIRHNPETQADYVERLSGNIDPRFVRTFAAGQSITTTGGQNDAGLFEFNFRDDRLLPFEGTGAISRWRLSVPEDSNWFDHSSLIDAILHIRYTSTDAGEPLRSVAIQSARSRLPSMDNPAVRVVDVRHDLPAVWSELARAGKACLPLSRERFFPWQSAASQVVVTEIEIQLVRNDGTAAVEIAMVQGPSDANDRELTLYRDSEAPFVYRAVLANPTQSLGDWYLSLQTPALEEMFITIRYYYR